MPTKSLADWDLKATSPGHLEATFSRFGVVDRDGDLTLATAFTDGQRVPMVWAHKWDQPIGDGVIQVKADRATFVGQFWMDVLDGEQAYRKVKRAGDLQDYSYGFQITDAAPGVHDGQPVRVLKSLEVFEVSPVLVGAGVGTGTESIKDGVEKAQWTGAYINTLPDSAFAVVLPGGSRDEEGKTVPRSLRKLPHHDAGGTLDLPHLRNALARLPQADLPSAAAATARRHLERHASGAGVGERGLHLLEHALVDLGDAKIGRRFSAATRRDIQAVIEALGALIAEPDDEEPAKTVLPVTAEWVAQFRARHHLS